LTQIDELSAQFDEIEDPYLRERKADIQQVAERVLKVLLGTEQMPPKAGGEDEFQAQMIIVAHDISPADMLQFRDRSFIGFRHRRRRAELAHRHRRAQPRYSGGGRHVRRPPGSSRTTG
jgi:phosphoenolpyruvate-protein kinase (PTS system EI component)